MRCTVIVTGREAQLIREAAAGPGISFVHNPNYASTKMFDSACIGMRALPASLEGTLFLPADAPVFSLFTVKQLQQFFDRSSAFAFRPVYKNEPGHPLLLRRSFLPIIYKYNGHQGLRGVLSQAGDRLMDVPVPDPGILMDADFPEEYEALLTYERAACVPSREACLELLTWKKLPTVVVAHSLAVADRAVSMAKAFNRAGGNLSIELIEAAALLHDIAKGTPDHGRTGALWLRQMGFPQVATAMEHHTHLPGSMQHILDEAAVVFRADKLFINDRPCTIEERYALRALEFPDAAALITEKAGQAKDILTLFEKHIHIRE